MQVNTGILQKIGEAADDDIPLAEAALQLAALLHEGIDLDRYRHHLDKLAEEVGVRYKSLIEAGADDDAKTKVAALKHIISDQHSYEGDKDNYDDLQNADLIRVIDRRKGLPIALAIIALHAAQGQGWDIEGLNFPGHFLLRLIDGPERVIADPFNKFQILQAPELRGLIKQIAGPDAELSSNYYDPATSRDILVRLQNNIKHRQIEHEDYDGALQTVEVMRLVAPEEYRLLFDSGVLHARTGHILKAIELIERYLVTAPDQIDRYDAQLFLSSLKDSLQ